MDREKLFGLLDGFNIETPSWGYADTGTRFGKFLQPAAAGTIEEKLADAGAVHQFTGCCPTVAVHVLWDFKVGVDASETAGIAKKHGVRIGAINPNFSRTSATSWARRPARMSRRGRTRTGTCSTASRSGARWGATA